MNIEELKQAVQEFKYDNPLCGLEIVTDKYIPDDITILENDKQMAVCYHDDKQIVVFDKPKQEFKL